MRKRVEYEVGSGNVFADIGLPNAEEHLVKAQLVFKIDGLLKKRRLKQVEAAKLFGVAQPDVSKMLRGGFRQFSVERLMRFLVALGQNVEIVVTPHRGRRAAAQLRVIGVHQTWLSEQRARRRVFVVASRVSAMSSPCLRPRKNRRPPASRSRHRRVARHRARVCVALAHTGAHVVLIARTVGGLEEVDDETGKAGGSATLVPLDLKDYDGIDRLGAALFERFGRVDALLANAGVLGAMTPLAHLQPKLWDEAVAVNVTANWRLIRAFDPLLRASHAGRVVFVSSGAARSHRAYWGSYSVTKAALESLALTYAAECAETSVRVNLFNPGPTRTAMRAKAFPGEDPMTLPAPEDVAPKIVELLSPSCEKNGELVNFRS